ncbi:MAG: AAA family ATPase [Pirellulaceae bacterium]|nr:AAA family ATPase [Pirellulaceae bacterium]
MSALDQAFIKAYAKEPAAKNAAQNGGSAEFARPSTVAERPPRVPLNHMASTQIENIYAAGTLYRIETPRAAEPAPVPPPHFGMRASRRLPLRYRLAQLESEEIATPPAKRVPQPVVQPATPAPKPARRMRAQIPALPPLPTASVIEIVEPREVVVVNSPPVVEVKAPPVQVPVPILPLANAMEVCESWDELLGESPVVANSALAVWPREEDLAAAHPSSLITLDLETMPQPPAPVTEFVQELSIETGAPEASSAKTYRLDAAHVPVPAPHQPPQPTLEDLIKPAVEETPAKAPEPKTQDRPLVVSEEEAAELVGAKIHSLSVEAAPAKPNTPAPHHFQPLIPAWEVDRFLWPALCEKLLCDEQSYFAQAGGKIASAVRDGLKSLAITGSRRGEGRTTLALCLARSAAQAGLKVVLVDADFARPQLAAALGLEIAASWHEAALGKTSLAEAAIKSLEDNLTVLPLDVSTAAAPLSLADPRLTRTLRDAARSFDLLVLDLGPTSAGSDSLFPEDEPPPADAAIVVRDLRYSTSAESQAIGERLSLSGIEAVGIAENFVPHEKLVA